MTADPTLRALAEHTGPVASVYIATPGDVAQAPHRSELQWRAVREHLVAQGAPEDVLAAVDPLVADAHLRGPGLAVLAGADGVRHAEPLPEPPPADHGWWEPLPALMPLIRRRQSEPPYLVVMTDRRGADITLVVDGAAAPAEDTGEATAAFDPDAPTPIRKVRQGGWSQRRIQQRAENAWEMHAREIATEVENLADDIRAELVLVGGDVRAVELLEEHLPKRVLQRVEELPGGRSEDGSDDEVEEATRRWVATTAAQRVVAVLERFREEAGQHDRAADGVDATRRALELGQVETLLVHDDWTDDRRADAGDGTDVRLVDVLIRDALRTDAAVMIVPVHGGPRDGVGALLRWA